MWVLALAFNLCMVNEPGCDPQYIYVARFPTLEACKAKIKPGGEALHCVRE